MKGNRRMKINADTDVCIGAGQCVLAAEQYFDQNDEDGTVVVLNAEPDEADRSKVEDAVATCPSGALSLTES